MKPTAIAALIGSILIATPALAESGLYYGLGLGYGSLKSESDFPGANSSASIPLISLTSGYRIDKGAMFYAGELDADFGLGGDFTGDASGGTCAVFAEGPYYCTHDMTARVRGMAGTTIGSLEMFGTLGFAVVSGTSAVDPSEQAPVTSTGYTVGFGAQQPMGAGTGRLELIYDNAPKSNNPFGYNPTYSAVSLKATFLF